MPVQMFLKPVIRRCFQIAEKPAAVHALSKIGNDHIRHNRFPKTAGSCDGNILLPLSLLWAGFFHILFIQLHKGHKFRQDLCLIHKICGCTVPAEQTVCASAVQVNAHFVFTLLFTGKEGSCRRLPLVVKLIIKKERWQASCRKTAPSAPALAKADSAVTGSWTFSPPLPLYALPLYALLPYAPP